MHWRRASAARRRLHFHGASRAAPAKPLPPPLRRRPYNLNQISTVRILDKIRRTGRASFVVS